MTTSQRAVRASRWSTTASRTPSSAGSPLQARPCASSRTTSTPTSSAGYDGVLLSPGPGDPAPLQDHAATIRDLLGRTNVLGICLGHQVLAMATGHDTFKLPFGHRGANHPVLQRTDGRVLVTSQNHGFAVEATDSKEATHVSLYDDTVEGLEFPDLHARSLQFHPEAGPGPHDAWPLIQHWVDAIASGSGGTT